MGNVKDRYIHYEKAGDEFVGRSVTGISSLTPAFAVSPVYFDPLEVDGDHEKLKKMVESTIAATLVKRSEISAPTYELLTFLLANLCFHFEYLDTTLPSDHSIRVSPVFSAVSRSPLRKYAVIRYPWNSTMYTPVTTGIPPHVVMMNQFKSFKLKLEKQTGNLIDALKKELNDRGVGGDAYKANQILQDLKDQQDSFLTKMNNAMGNSGGSSAIRRGPGPGWEDGIHSNFIVIDPPDPGPDGSPSDDEGGAVNDATDSPPPVVNQPKGVVIKFSNCRNGKFWLLPPDYKFPKAIGLELLFTLWFCGDRSNNIPPYRMLKWNDLDAKTERTKLSMIRKVMNTAVRGARDISGRPELLNHRVWTYRNALDLFEGVKHLFLFPILTTSRKNKSRCRRFETISWKTYYNILVKRKWRLLGESDS